jgi:hypothetical protein
MELFALILNTLGTLLIAYAALNVHHRFRHEHKVDDVVFNAMRKEYLVGWFGIVMIILSFILEILLLLSIS